MYDPSMHNAFCSVFMLKCACNGAPGWTYKITFTNCFINYKRILSQSEGNVSSYAIDIQTSHKQTFSSVDSVGTISRSMIRDEELVKLDVAVSFQTGFDKQHMNTWNIQHIPAHIYI